MSPREVAWRGGDVARRRYWARYQVTASSPPADSDASFAASLRSRRQFGPGIGPETIGAIGAAERARIIDSADDVLAGRWEVLGCVRKDLRAPDWFFDPDTSRRSPRLDYCFSIDHRSEDVTGNVKQIWEISRMHHVTVLAAAYALSGDERYADSAARNLRSWWAQNPFLSGVNWTSGIEVGMRLIAWVWTRRLLDGWDQASILFEENEVACRQIWWHQRYLAAFRSRGSSANNHVIAEAAGQLTAALGFPWFEESDRWASDARELLESELVDNTFPSGANRELASEYHGFVAELVLLAAAEADHADYPLSERSWGLLCRAFDVAAAIVDVGLRPPRQGDGDEGRGLVLESGPQSWASLLATGRAVFGPMPWWPTCPPDVRATLLASMVRSHSFGCRPDRRPDHLPDAGISILRSAPGAVSEIWCRCDGGPHGYLSIAAHAHADALSVEVRHDGVDVLADPGTYCYHGEAEWRTYFRSTVGHNTLELAGRSQSQEGGPFLWTRHAGTRKVEMTTSGDGCMDGWAAEHDGYAGLDPPAIHRREVRLFGDEGRLEITDRVATEGSHAVRLVFHLGPDVLCELTGSRAKLRWLARAGSVGTACVALPADLAWSASRGSVKPLLGWYSARFGSKQPATTLVGEGICVPDRPFVTVMQFDTGLDARHVDDVLAPAG